VSTPSNWPLPALGQRLLTPTFIREALAQHPLSQDCYPTAMGFYPEAQGHVMVRERHDDNLFIFCCRGSGTLQTRFGVRQIKAGDAMLLPSQLPHRYWADDNSPWTLYWAHFAGSLANTLMRHLGSPEQIVIHPRVQPTLLAEFAQLMAVERTGYSIGAYLAASARLRQLLLACADWVERQTRTSSREFDVERIQAYMRAQVASTLTLTDLADIAGISRSHFAQRYRELTGYPPLRHFTHMRMEAACRLLDSTQQSVKQVAAELGYEDPLYFSRVFRRVVGVAPKDYRKLAAA